MDFVLLMKLCWFALRWLRISRILSSFWSVCCFKSESDTFVYPAIWKWTYADSVKPILKLNFDPGWRFNLPKINGDYDQIFSSNRQMHFFFPFFCQMSWVQRANLNLGIPHNLAHTNIFMSCMFCFCLLIIPAKTKRKSLLEKCEL